MGVGLAVIAMLIGAAGCVVYGLRMRYDQRLKTYRARDPFRTEQEREGRLWIAGGSSLFVLSVAVWWLTRG